MDKISQILLLSFLLFIVGTASHGQCDERYQTVIFDNVVVETVVYSEVSGYEMDVYQPIDDMYSNRPVIIFAHSGAFYTGNKNSEFIETICTKFAKRGYVTASIQYTLADSLEAIVDSLHLQSVMVQAVADGKSAIRFFRKTVEEGNRFGIDGNQIWIGGNSAGAMLSLQLAYLDNNDTVSEELQAILDMNGGIAGNRGNDGYSSNVNGVISLSGAIIDPNWIDPTENEALASCHGSIDDIVHIDYGKLFWNVPPFSELDFMHFYGSAIYHNKADDVGLDNALQVFENLNHVPWLFDGPVQDDMIDFVQQFLFDRIECNLVLSTDELIHDKFSIYPNPASSNITIESKSENVIEGLQLFDLNGRIVLEVQTSKSDGSISILNLQSGVYFVRLHSEGKIYNEKIVIE